MIKHFIVLFALNLSLSAMAQTTPKTNHVDIHSSLQCDQCKTRIEKKLYKLKGIVDAQVTITDKMIHITYKTNKTNIDAIRLYISKIGYDADQIPADKEAYEQLPDCCKKDGGH
ncbi:MAG: cation transporter [Flavobacteriales bacterium]|nr:cation transporter [Flavobacteriales bacterium]